MDPALKIVDVSEPAGPERQAALRLWRELRAVPARWRDIDGRRAVLLLQALPATECCQAVSAWATADPEAAQRGLRELLTASPFRERFWYLARQAVLRRVLDPVRLEVLLAAAAEGAR